MPENLFFENFREWSERKHSLLRNYLRPFTRILGAWEAGAFCVDGFAGRGEYADGRVGSSVMSAELAAEFRSTGTKRLQCVNVERNREYFRGLDDVTSKIAPGLVHNFHGTFASRINQVLDIVGSAPALFFLDPYGIRGIEWTTLGQLVDRSGPTELLVRLHTPYLHRLAGFLSSNAPAAKANVALITETIGGDEWMDYAGADQEEFAKAAVAVYRKALRRHFAHVGAYPVRTLESERLKYHMVFCSRHPRGALIMSDVVYKTDERFLDQRRQVEESRGIQLGLLEQTPLPQELADHVYEEKLRDLATRVHETVVSGGSMSYIQMKSTLVDEFFGVVSDHYYRRAVKQLWASALLRGDPSSAVNDATILQA